MQATEKLLLIVFFQLTSAIRSLSMYFLDYLDDILGYCISMNIAKKLLLLIFDFPILLLN